MAQDLSAQQPETDEDLLFCPVCGYDLKGLTSQQCPECGADLDWDQLRRAQIPWTYRKDLGLLRSYWRTVWFVMFRFDRFCREIARPVSYRDAQLFRWMTISHVYVALLAITVVAYALYAWDVISEQWLEWMLSSGWPVLIVHGLVVMFVFALAGVPSYWFHPRSLPMVKQNRAVAMSYYTAAPLAWTPITVVAVTALAVTMSIYLFGMS